MSKAGSGASSYSQKRRSIFIGLVLAGAGLIPGIVVLIMANSVTVLSDLLRNANLFIAVLLSWLAFRRASGGKSAFYDYGFGKLENLSSLVVASLMMVSVTIVVYQIIGRFQNPTPVREVGAGIGVAFSAIATMINGWMWRDSLSLAKKDPSPVMESLWRVYRLKAVSTLCVVASLGLSLAFKDYPWSVHIDAIGSIVMLAFLIYSAYGVVSSSVYDLLDRTLDESIQLMILRELAIVFESYVAIHGVRSRRSGGNVFIEVFLEFDGEQKMSEVQTVIDSVKSNLEQKIPASQVVIVPATAAVG